MSVSTSQIKKPEAVLLDVQNIDVVFNQRQEAALNNISFSIKPGQIVTLVGPNGAGKSTLIKVALGLIKPTRGKVTRKKNLKVAYVPQKLEIDPSVPINVERFMRLIQSADKHKILAALDKVNAKGLIKDMLSTLSGGELQRVMLAQSIIHKPDLLILDEPAAGVDVNGQTQLYALIEKIKQDTGCAILLISHDLHIVMAATDEVLCLNKHLCCHGSPEDVRQHPEFIELFGENSAQHIAVYKHLHNHQHHLDGEIIEH